MILNSKETEMKSAAPEGTVLHLIEGFVIEESPVPFYDQFSTVVKEQIKVNQPSNKKVDPKLKSNSLRNIISPSRKQKHQTVNSNKSKTREENVNGNKAFINEDKNCSKLETNHLERNLEEVSDSNSSYLSTKSNDGDIGSDCSLDVEDTGVEIKKPIDEWTEEDVFYFISNTDYLSKYANEFRLQEIDGSALQLLKIDHLINSMNFNLGPALKLIQKIETLQKVFNNE